MIFIGKREAIEFIEEWEGKLSSKYAEAWKIFKQRRDIVAAKMCLNEKEKLFITAMNMANYAGWDIKTQYKLNDDREKVINTRGNTEAIKTVAELSRVFKNYEEKCDYFLKQFNAEMEKLKNNRR